MVAEMRGAPCTMLSVPLCEVLCTGRTHAAGALLDVFIFGYILLQVGGGGSSRGYIVHEPCTMWPLDSVFIFPIQF